MNYEQAKAIVLTEAPDIIVGSPHSDHIALKKSKGDTPFCITIPKMAHLMAGESDEKITSAEKAFFLDSVQAFKNK